MNELTQALAEAIRTGADLARPAMYLYFGTQVLQALAFSVPLMSLIWGGYRLIKLKITTPSDEMLKFLTTGKPVSRWDEAGVYDWVPSPALLRRCGFTEMSVDMMPRKDG